MKLSKIFSAALAAAMILVQASAFSAYAASAEDDELSDGTFTYEIVDGGYAIVECDTTAIITDIPSMRNGYAIVEIADQAFLGCTYITELTIPSTVKTIGAYAFAGCTGLKTVSLPYTLTEISDAAFDACTNLTEINIPEGVESIGTLAFAQCTSLESVTLPDSLVSIGDNAFDSCGALTEIDIPSNVMEIGEMAFINCYSLEKITADDNSAFVVEDNVLYDADMTELYRAAAHNIDTIFYVSDTVTTIKDGAFSYCTELTTVFVPSSVTLIGQEAFFFCTSLENIDLSEGLLEIDSSAFAHCTALTSIEFPTTLLSIGEGTFFDAAVLEKVIFSDGITDIADGAFAVCDSLTNVIVPSSVESIGDYAFGYTLNDNQTDYTQMTNFSMSVKSGSAALKYAKDNDLDYTVSDRSLKRLAFIIVCVGLILAAAVFATVLMRRGRKLAPADVRKAEALEDEENDPSYEGIVADKSNEQNEQDVNDESDEEK